MSTAFSSDSLISNISDQYGPASALLSLGELASPCSNKWGQLD